MARRRKPSRAQVAHARARACRSECQLYRKASAAVRILGPASAAGLWHRSDGADVQPSREVETGWLLLQLKATDRIKDVDRRQALSCGRACASAPLLRESHPVILALYDARADLAYCCWWVAILKTWPGSTVRTGERLSVSIPRGNVLDRKAMKSWHGGRTRGSGPEEEMTRCLQTTFRLPSCDGCSWTSASGSA